MYKRILVPLDGSERAEQALPVAALLARASGGTVMLVRASGRPPLQTPLREPSQAVLERAEATRAQDEAYLVAASEHQPLAGIPVEVCALIGSPAEVIVEAAGDTAADLIVICSHGRSGLTRWALGSVAQKVARHATVPVLVLRSGNHAQPLADADHAVRALIGLDGSALAEGGGAPRRGAGAGAIWASWGHATPHAGGRAVARCVVRPCPSHALADDGCHHR